MLAKISGTPCTFSPLEGLSCEGGCNVSRTQWDAIRTYSGRRRHPTVCWKYRNICAAKQIWTQNCTPS